MVAYRQWALKVWLLLGLLVGAATAAPQAQAVDLTGVGASLPYPLYARWAAAYYERTGHRVNYQSIGSGGGQQQIIARTVDFGASDDPMPGEELDAHGLLQFPAVMGGTVPVVNIPGIQAGALRLTGKLLADIYLGKVTRWNDEAIAALNPELRLPDQLIVVVHRADGSGTTFLWTNYLSKVSNDWKEQVGEGKAVKWPVGQGGKGNEGVAAYVRQLRYSVGYVEFAYAKQNQLAWVVLQNQDGHFVQPSARSFAAAGAYADWDEAPGMGAVLTNTPGEQSWPITAASFILLHKRASRPKQTLEVLRFFQWAFYEGASMALELDYVPLPESVVALIEARWRLAVRTPDGRPLWD